MITAYQWVLISIFIIALVLELLTLDLISIWFGLAVIPSFILDLLHVPLPISLTTFLLFSLALLLLTRPFVMKYVRKNEIKTNVESYIGELGTVLTAIHPNQIGEVKLKHLIWSAISKEDIEAGSLVRILDIEGNKLIVTKVKE